MARLFAHRAEAGERLAPALQHLRSPRTVVLGLPRGGVPVGYEVARRLDAPLDVIVVRKVGVPLQPELAMGAVGEGGVLVVNERVVRSTDVTSAELADAEERERAVVERSAERLRAGRPRLSLEGRTAVVVDDGIATGATARAACRVARALGAQRVVMAAPVAPAGVADRFGDEVDEVVCPHQPATFAAVGQFYADFTQIGDDDVSELLHRRAEELQPRTVDSAHGFDEEVVVDVGGVALPGHLNVPRGARGVVLFAHGSGSSRHSPRNAYVASVLQHAGFATLLLDLLTDQEARHRSSVFDVELLAHRLGGATSWVHGHDALGGLALGYFGASTGAAAALWAVADPRHEVAAVVSRGGRPDLAAQRLAEVRAPTLLIVGGRDSTVLELNRVARTNLRCESELAVVPGATHLFEERGALARVAVLARAWFTDHVGPRADG